MSCSRIPSALRRSVLLAPLLLLLLPARVPACVGDCDANSRVTIDELVRGVNIVLGALPAVPCTAFDRDASQTVTIDELVAAVAAALQGIAACADDGNPCTVDSCD